MKFHRFKDTQTLDQQFARLVAVRLTQAIDLRGEAYLVVSGGKTPLSFFTMLAQEELDWSRVTITLADERWLTPMHPDSNEHLVRTCLLMHHALDARFMSLYRAQDSVFSNVEDIEPLFAQLPIFDVVILGMGEDGHTASLFPCSEQISTDLETSKAVLAVLPGTAPYQRISLSKKRLLNTRSLYLHLVGEKKKRVFEQACQSDNATEMPIRAFLNDSKVNMQVMFAP